MRWDWISEEATKTVGVSGVELAWPPRGGLLLANAAVHKAARLLYDHRRRLSRFEVCATLLPFLFRSYFVLFSTFPSLPLWLPYQPAAAALARGNPIPPRRPAPLPYPFCLPPPQATPDRSSTLNRDFPPPRLGDLTDLVRSPGWYLTIQGVFLFWMLLSLLRAARGGGRKDNGKRSSTEVAGKEEGLKATRNASDFLWCGRGNRDTVRSDPK
eukprot:1183376-Prorocentrum_minimum.AAC.3